MICCKCKTTIQDDADVCFHCGVSQGFSPELIQKAKENDQNAITELYNKVYPSRTTFEEAVNEDVHYVEHERYRIKLP